MVNSRMILKSGIYKITSRINGKIYIGSSVRISKRKTEHLYHLKKNTHNSIKLQNHYNKYGAGDLIFDVIELCCNSDLLPREQFYIDELKPYFNICKIAGNTTGWKHSDNTKNLISKLHKGKTITEEHRQSCREKLKNREISKEHRLKISNSLKLHERSKSHSINISIALKGKKQSKLQIMNKSFSARRFSILQFDTNNNLIKVHDTSAIAEMNTGIPKKNIQKCCRGKYKTASGFIFRYGN